MNMRGWCPIISSKTSEEENLRKCITDDCAWWDTTNKCCVVFSINNHIQKITSYGSCDLQDICSKLSSLED